MNSEGIILDILSENLKLKKNDIDLCAHLEKDLNIDSTEIIGVLVALEKRLGIKLDDTVFEKLSDVLSLIELVDSKLSN